MYFLKVLDLDMDYFMETIANTPFYVTERLSEEDYGNYVWSKERVIHFFEHNLGLSKSKKILGRIVKGHDESLYFWEELISKGQLQDPFEVIHVDSHADLGLGTPTSNFLQEGILVQPIEIRRLIRDYEFNGDTKKINIGDYLLWAIAYRMISKITYCANPNGDKNDYCWNTLKNFKENFVWDKPVSNYIQLKYNENYNLPKYNSPKEYIQKYLDTCIEEPEVELRIIPTIEDVNFYGDFDYAILAQSPNYTPKSADFIMDLFKEYIEEI